MRITVIGGGSWATAIIKILSESNVKIKWWLRSKQAVDHIKVHHHNPHYISSVELHPSRVKPYHNIKDALKKTDWVILAIPGAFIADALEGLDKSHFHGKKVISAIKGMEPSSKKLISHWFEDRFNVPLDQQGIIAGPCHAEEVAQEKQSYLTIASPNKQLAQEFSDTMSCRFVKASPSSDLEGVEYAAVMKNIVAIASGIAHGIGSGDNFQAVLISNAMKEMRAFVSTIAPGEREMSESAYLGDLLVTAYSQFSRNRTFGNMLGRGYSVKNAQLEMNMIAEGYYAVSTIYQIAEENLIELPVCTFVYDIIHKKMPPKKAFKVLKEQLS